MSGQEFKIAAIDLGTNSFHMVIATVNNQGIMNIIAREKETVRLGSSSGDMKFIQPDAMKRAIKCLERFSAIAKVENARIKAIATSAVREALNQEQFADKVKLKTGIDIEVISGIEEARLINEGVLHSLNIYKNKSFVIDIGGGSTETIVSTKGEIQQIHSAKLGAIRLTKKYFDDGVIDEDRIKKCIDFIKGEWSITLQRIKEEGFEVALGTSGTIQTLVTMAYLNKKKKEIETINGLSINTKHILAVINTLKSCKNVSEISQIAGVDTSRADILLAGALILEYAITYLSIGKLVLSSFALREGIVFDTFHQETNLNKYHHLSDIRYRSILSTCEKYQADIKHASHVKEICTEIFNNTKEIHGFSDRELELLDAAAYLHDIGFFISHDAHHKHSYYLIKNAALPGFTNGEQEIIANIARYHRKSHPKKSHENFALLSEYWQGAVWVLAGILRIAEGVDRRQIQAVKKIEVSSNKENEIEIRLIPKKNEQIEIELWGANRRKDMLEQKISRKIKFL